MQRAAIEAALGGTARQMSETPTEPEADAAAKDGARLFGLTRNVMLLGLVSLLTDLSSEMSLTFLPFFLANVLGAKTAVIGVIEGLGDTAASLTRMASGYASDKWRKRKALVVVGYGLSAVTKPFLYFANSWGSVLGLRFVDRVGKGVRTSPRDALLAASTPVESRGLAFGFHRGADTAGAFLGLLAVAAIIYLSQGWAAQLQEAAFRRLVLAAVVPGLAAVAVLCAVRELPPALVRKAAPGEQRVLLSRRFKLFLAATALFGLANSSDAFLLLRAQSLGLCVGSVALLLAGFNLCYSLLSPVGGRLSDRWGRPALIGAGWTLYTISYLGFGLARECWHIWLLFGLYAVYYGLAEGSARALVADLVPDEQRGSAYGLYNTMVGVAALPASLLAGLVWQGVGSWAGWGPGAPFLMGAAFSAGALTLLMISMRGLQRPTA